MNGLGGPASGRFGRFGGRYAPETLMGPLMELEASWLKLKDEPAFAAELAALLKDFVGRPTALTPSGRLGAELGLTLYLKREDLAHTGAHKINNTVGQVLLAKRMGKTRVIAETGAGQHGVATATAAARLGLSCVVYMGSVDMERQALNVYRMQLLGAEVRAVESGSKTLKDAVNEAMRDWAASVTDTHYVLGSALGPHPFPAMVRGFHEVIGREARAQILEKAGRLPDLAVACVGGGSNAIGLFSGFLADASVALVGVEAGGRGFGPGEHAARFAGGEGGGRPGILHGSFTVLLQDSDGQVRDTHSVSAGLDYPAVGPEHAALAESGRARYESVTDAEALAAFDRLARTEGILPALESSHAVAWLCREAAAYKGKLVILNLSGRGDKDVESVRKARGDG